MRLNNRVDNVWAVEPLNRRSPPHSSTAQPDRSMTALTDALRGPTSNSAPVIKIDWPRPSVSAVDRSGHSLHRPGAALRRFVFEVWGRQSDGVIDIFETHVEL